MAEKTWKDYREESKKAYGCNQDLGKGVSVDQLNAGSLMRIADALEIRNTDIVATIAEKNRLGREVHEVTGRARTEIALLHEQLAKIRKEAENYQTYWNNALKRGDRLERSMIGLRGYIGRLKKRGK